MGFRGVIITDDLSMDAIDGFFPEADSAVTAMKGGVDEALFNAEMLLRTSAGVESLKLAPNRSTPPGVHSRISSGEGVPL